MNIKFTKKEKIVLVIYLFIIFILGLGISFSFFILADSNEKNSTRVYAGTLNINYIQGDQITTSKLQPITEPDFYATSEVYRNRFSVKTEGTLEQTVTIEFEILENEFSSDMLRYAFYNGDGEKISTGYLNSGSVTLEENVYFDSNEIRDYVLIIWLEEQTSDQSAEQGCSMSGKMHVYSRQYGY